MDSLEKAMRRFCLIILFQLTVGIPPSKAASTQPEEAVRKLYQQIIARKPLGIPYGADKKPIWPLLSKRLIEGLEAGHACEKDYARHLPIIGKSEPGIPPEIIKPELAWLEVGLFSGSNEKALPAEAVVEGAEQQKDGSFLVYIKLTYDETHKTYGRPPNPQNKFSWLVAATVVLERGRSVVDDILFFEEGTTKVMSHLLDAFRQCQGTRWIGDSLKNK
jgi:hypothetical protein